MPSRGGWLALALAGVGAGALWYMLQKKGKTKKSRASRKGRARKRRPTRPTHPSRQAKQATAEQILAFADAILERSGGFTAATAAEERVRLARAAGFGGQSYDMLRKETDPIRAPKCWRCVRFWIAVPVGVPCSVVYTVLDPTHNLTIPSSCYRGSLIHRHSDDALTPPSPPTPPSSSPSQRPTLPPRRQLSLHRPL